MADACSRMKHYRITLKFLLRSLEYAYLLENHDLELLIYDKLG